MIAGIVPAWLLLPIALVIDPPRVDTSGAVAPVITRITERLSAVDQAPAEAEAWGAYAMALHAHSYDAAADVAYAEAERLDPSSFHWPYLRAMLTLRRDAEAALALFDRALAIDPAYGPAHERRALVLEDIGRDDEARAACMEALRLRPRSASAHLHLGRLDLKAGRPTEAIRRLEAARRRWPTDAGVLSSLARAHARAGDRELARVLAEDARRGQDVAAIADSRYARLIAEGVTLPAIVARADNLARQGAFDRAVAELTGALELGHEPGPVQAVLANVELRAGRIDRAAAAADAALAAGETGPSVLSLAANAKLQLGRREEAAAHAAAALALDPNSVAALQALARIDVARGDFGAAIAGLDRAIELAPSPALSLQRGRTLSAAGRHDEAIATIAAVADRPGATEGIQFALVDALRAAGEMDAARDRLERLASTATTPRAGRFSAALLREEGRFGDAIQRLKTLGRQFPRHPNVMNDLSWLLATTPDASLRDGVTAAQMMTAVVGRPQFRRPEFLDTYAAALAEVGRFDEAVAAVDEAMSLVPADARAPMAERRRAYVDRQPWRAEVPG